MCVFVEEWVDKGRGKTPLGQRKISMLSLIVSIPLSLPHTHARTHMQSLYLA